MWEEKIGFLVVVVPQGSNCGFIDKIELSLFSCNAIKLHITVSGYLLQFLGALKTI